ncbi:MAG: ACT domain-containing protein [Verrucomicrobiota bacterium]
MLTSFVMTILGADRAGLVESVAAVVAEHDGNWIESRMAHLAGQFAGIVRVEVPATKASALRDALGLLQDVSVNIEQDAGSGQIPKQVIALELVGPDRPGIIRELTRALRANQINVEELETECASAPMSGERLFRAQAKLGIQEATTLENLRSELETIANDLTLEIDLIERSPIAG